MRKRQWKKEYKKLLNTYSSDKPKEVKITTEKCRIVKLCSKRTFDIYEIEFLGEERIKEILAQGMIEEIKQAMEIASYDCNDLSEPSREVCATIRIAIGGNMNE